MKTKLLFLPVITDDHPSTLTKNKLEISDDNTKINATIYLKVSTEGFKKCGDVELFAVAINNMQHYGLAYRYVNDDPAIFDTGESETVEFTFEFTNAFNWIKDQDIKIMSLNESNQKAFTDLRPYFEKRLSEYPTVEMSVTQLKDFDTEWNSKHEDTNSRHLRVNTHLDEDDKEKEKFTPKLTKQDMIIRLTKK